jgi:hypothetical protein
MRKDTKNIYLSGHGLNCPYCFSTSHSWAVTTMIDSQEPVGACGTQFWGTDFEETELVIWQCDVCGGRWGDEIGVVGEVRNIVGVREVPDETAP